MEKDTDLAFDTETRRLVDDVHELVERARNDAARTVNASLVTMYWNVGRRIGDELIGEARAAYGERIVATLSRELGERSGEGFSAANLWRMVRFAGLFSDSDKVATLSRELSWSHFVALLTVEDPLAREFYAEMSRVERWSVRTLKSRMQGMLFERTALSRKPAELARAQIEALRAEDRITPDLVFRDPYLLDFLGLEDRYGESELETAILRDLESFILELGTGFSFVARQKRMVIDGEDHHLDLLFFHRGLRCLVAVELKLGKFRAEHKGQMELYLGWLDRHEREPGEQPPLGLVLCADKGEQTVELLRLEASGIRVAAYLTALPPREILERRLHDAVAIARARFPEADEE